MAEDNLNQPEADVTTHDGPEVSTFDALHLDGKGTDRLDDAEEQDMPEGSAGEKEDVKGFANVQSANRETFEKMQAGAPAEEGVVPVGDQVIPEVYTPSEPDNQVEARFENPQPNFVPDQTAETEDNSPTGLREAVRPEPERQAERPVANGEGEDNGEDGAAAPAAAPDVVPEEVILPPPVVTPEPDPNPPVAQAPTLTVTAATGTEDVPTKLQITASTADSDGGAETLSSIQISGVPDYFIIVDGNGNPVGTLSGGTWTLANPTQAQLDDLYLKNLDDDDDGDFSGTLNLTVTATSSDNGTSAMSSAPLAVTIVAVADAPGLSVENSAGMENTWIDLSIDVVDKDVGVDNSESQTIYVSGLPGGASLRYTDGDGNVHVVTGSAVTNDADGLPDGTYFAVPAAYQSSVEVLPATNDSTDFTLTVYAKSVEDSNGDTALSGPQTIQVDVGVVDPSASGSGSGNEDSWADLTLSANVNQADGSESITVYIEDLPAGVILRDANGNVLTTTTYTDADGNTHTGYDVTAYRDAADGSIDGLQVGWDTNAPATTHLDDNISFNLRAVVRDGDTDNDAGQYRDTGTTVVSRAPDVSDVVTPVSVVVKAVADAPTLSASAIGVEDKWFSLDIQSSLVDQDGSETLSITVTGNPDEFSLRDGTTGNAYTAVDNGNGTVTYTLTPAQLNNLQVKGGQDSDSDFNLVVKATATEGASDAETAVRSATTTQVVNVQVLSDADTPHITVVPDPVLVNEDQFVGLRDLISGTKAVQAWLGEFGGADGGGLSPDSSETLTFQLVAKDESRIWIDADGDGTQDAGEVTTLQVGDTVTLTAAQVFGNQVKVGGVADWGSSGSTDLVQFDIKVIATETRDSTDDGLESQLEAGLTRSGTAESGYETLSLYVTPQFDSATVGASNSGKEDQFTELAEGRIALTPTVVFTDTDGSEQPDPNGTTTITTTDPEMVGGDIYVNGVKLEPTSVTYAADGVTVTSKTWDVPNSTLTETSDNNWVMGGVTFQSERHVAGESSYSISVAVYDTQASVTSSVTGTGTLSVAAIADTPLVAVSDVALTETAGTQAIDLAITPTPVDLDGSETLYVYVTGVPDGVTLNHGTAVASGTVVDGVTFTGTTYKLTQAELSGLKANLPAGYSDDFKLTVYSAAEETTTGQSVVAGQGVAISAAATLDVQIGILDPTITVGSLVTNEDAYYALGNVTVTNPADDATDSVTVSVSGLTSGFTLYQSNGSGGYVALTANGDGSYTIPAGLIDSNGHLSGVYIKGPADSDADATFTLTVSKQDVDYGGATSHEQGATIGGVNVQDKAVVSQTLTVTVNPVLDAVTVTGANSGVEDQHVENASARIALTPTVTFTDGDGSETPTAGGFITLSTSDSVMTQGTVYVTVNGSEVAVTPAGVYDGQGNLLASVSTSGGTTTWTFANSYLTEGANNVWTLSGVTIQPERHDAGNASYNITVDVDDNGGAAAEATGTGTLVVAAIADTPLVSAQDISLTETAAAQSIDISITPTLVDTDGSETLYVYVTGLPSGVTLNHGTSVASGTVVDGVTFTGTTYKLTQAELSGLKANLPAGYSNDFQLSVYSATVETTTGQTVVAGEGVAISTAATLDVQIGVLDPTITVGTLTTNEDVPLSLAGISINVPADDATDTLTVRIEGLSAGFTLTKADGTALTANADGSYTIPSNLIVNNTLSGVYLKGTGNSDSDATFTVRAVKTDVDVGTSTEDAMGTTYQDSAQDVENVTVTVKAVADAPTLTAKAVGVEDKWINLNISAALTDTDGSENLTVVISGVPDTFTLSSPNTSVVAVTSNGTTTYTVGPAESNEQMAGWLSDLRLTGLAEDSDYGQNTTDFTLTVKAIATEEASGAAQVDTQTATTTATVNVQVFGDADKPVVTVLEGASAATAVVINEDSFYSLKTALATNSGEDLTASLNGLSADGSETLKLRITATEPSRIWIDSDGDGVQDAGEVTTLSAGQSKDVTVAQVLGNKVYVGGVTNWGDDTLKFTIKPLAVEKDSGASTTPLTDSNNFDTNTDNDLSRLTQQWGDSKDFFLRVNPVVDETYISSSVTGDEDQVGGIAFTPVIKLTDTDGSEKLTGNVDILVKQGTLNGHFELNGVTLVDSGDYTDPTTGVVYDVYTVPGTSVSGTPAAGYTLNGVTFVPTDNSDLDVTYRIRSTTLDDADGDGNGATYSTVTSEATLVVQAVADAPVLTIGSGVDVGGTITVTGDENDGKPSYHGISLNLSAAMPDQDGSETLSNAELRNVPDGWTVSYYDSNGNYLGDAVKGAADAEGDFTWTLNTAHVKAGSGISVVLVPPVHADADAPNVVFWAKTIEDTLNDADTDDQVKTAAAESSVTFNVVVNAVADQPNLQVTNARVEEDHSVKLDIRGALIDTDGSETLTYQISGAPSDASFVDANGNAVGTYSGGVWTFTASQVGNLYFKPGADSNVDANLTVTAIATETNDNGTNADNVATKSATIQVIVTGKSDGALDQNGNAITASSGNLTATGSEDQLINPQLGNYSVADQDVALGRAQSETLSMVLWGIPSGVSLVLVDTNGAVVETSDYLKYIGTAADGTAQWSIAPEYLSMVRFSAPSNYAGTFDVKLRVITTEDDGDSLALNKTLSVTVNPVADKASGSVTGSTTEDAWLAGGSDAGVAFGFSVDAGDKGGGNAVIGSGVAEQVTDVDVTVDVSELVSKGHVATGDLSVTYNGHTYTPTLVGGKWVIVINDVAVTPGTDVDVSGFKLFGVPADWSDDVPVTLSVTVTDTLNGTVSTRTDDINGSIKIIADADAPEFNINLGSSDLNASDGQAVLNGTISVGDSDGSESMYLVVSGVPNGVTIPGGINAGGGRWIVPSDDGTIENLTFNSSLKSGVHTLTIKALVTDTDPDGGSDTATGSTSVTIDFGTPSGGGTGSTIIPIATPSGSLTGTEDGSISLSGLTFSITDDDAATSHTYTHNGASVYDETNTLVGTLSVNFKLPAGWSISGSAYYDADSDSYTIPYGSLSSVSITPPKDYAGSAYDLDIRGVVTTTSGLYDTSSGNSYVEIPVDVTAVADGATIAVGAATATEDHAVAVTLDISARDVDFSEVLTNGTVTITVDAVSGHQPGTLSGAGIIDNGNGSYTLQLTPSQIAEFANSTDGKVTVSGLTFTPDANFSGSVKIHFSTGVTDGASTTTSSNTLTITVGAVIDDTTITANDVSGNEDTAIAVDVSIAHQDLAGTGIWGSENASVVIGNVPAGAVIEGALNNGDGTWTVKAANLTITANGIQLNGVKYLPAQDNSSDQQLTITTYVFEKGNSTPQVTTEDFWVHVNAVTDGATVNPSDVTTTEDAVIGLDLGAQLLDVVGDSEATTITITGVPAGASFASSSSDFAHSGVGTAVLQSDGTYTWTFSSAEVKAMSLTSGGLLYFMTEHNASGSWTMTVQATTQDVDSATDATQTAGSVVLSNSLSFTVTQTGVADAPQLSMTHAVTATEDNTQLLDISASLVDADSETLSITLSGAPVGTVFYYQEGGNWTAVHADNNGVWTIPGGTADSLSGIRMLTPSNYNGSFTLTVKAMASEAGTTALDADAQSGTPQTIVVTVDAVNDAPTLDVTTGAGAGAGTHASPIYVVPENPDPSVTNEITLSDVDSTVFTKMTMTIGGAGMASTDSLALNGVSDVELGADGKLSVTIDGATVTVSWDQATHTLTFEGNASAAQYQDLAQSVSLSSSTGSLADGQRVVTITATDDHGASGSDTATVTVTGTATLTGDALGDVSFASDGTAVLPASAVSGAEDATLALNLDMADAVGATQAVTITGIPEGTQFILADHSVVLAGAGGVTLQGSQLAGLSVNLNDWSGHATLVVSASIGGESLTESVDLSVTAGVTGTDPTGVVSGAVADPIHVVSGFTVADQSADLSGLTITMTGAGMNDSLALAGLDLTLDGNGGLKVYGTDISVNYDTDSHTLSFSGSGSASVYQEIANSVVLSNDTGTLEAGTRNFQISLYDSTGDADKMTTDATLSGTVTLTDDALGDVRWGADGTDLGDDIKVILAGSSTAEINGSLANYINGGAGTDTLNMETTSGEHGWVFTIDDNDHSKVTATSTTDENFVVHIDANVDATVNSDGDLVFNGDASGAITFDDNSTIHFAHIERLSNGLP
ncbi:hypothetical protein [Magnetospirillum sp. 64-120]|uniref:beta strand repeat-containing protein n=1 Tax=Magnetospirillum sp. 64-120 TaxID=1895778 RepID=UPI00092A0207|nr:hypothetical protein [Magnetospirillum sp. 64-120]OJX79626.1 MAG: hypothetical protein BGO92_14340 [Magnetospirillum sp. 64-120]